MKDMQGILDLLHAKVDELNAYASMYRSYKDVRAETCRIQSDVLSGILQSCGAQHPWELSKGIAPAVPHREHYGALTALVTEVGGQHTAILFENERSALAEEQRFMREHEILIAEFEVSCRTVDVDLSDLTASLLHADDPRIAYAFIGAHQEIYSVSLHDDALGAEAAMARFDIEYAEYVDAEEAWLCWNAVELPPGITGGY